MGSLDANKALGFALCFISMSATCLVLYFKYSTHGYVLTLYTQTHIHIYIYTLHVKLTLVWCCALRKSLTIYYYTEASHLCLPIWKDHRCMHSASFIPEYWVTTSLDLMLGNTSILSLIQIL